MAEAIAEGARSCGAEVSLTDVTSADDGILDGDVILFGCPAMGAEHWRNRSSGRSFPRRKEDCPERKSGCSAHTIGATVNGYAFRPSGAQTAGAVLIAEGLTAHNAPDEETLAACRALGQTAARR